VKNSLFYSLCTQNVFWKDIIIILFAKKVALYAMKSVLNNHEQPLLLSSTARYCFYSLANIYKKMQHAY